MISSCHTISTGILDPLSPPLPIVHCFQQVFRATSHIGTELLYVGSSWLSCLCSAMWRGLQECISYELIPTSPAVSSCMSGDILLSKETDTNLSLSLSSRLKNSRKCIILFTQPLHTGRIWHKVNFLAEFNRFEFRVFLLLD